MEKERKGVFHDFRNKKFFHPFDIVIYVVILFIITSLFLGVFSCKNSKSNDGFEVYRGNRRILSYVYGDGLLIEKGYEANIYSLYAGEILQIYINFDEKVNILQISESEKAVWVSDANCPTKDCVHTGKLTNKGVIFCLPHNIKIQPIDDSDELIVGGIETAGVKNENFR